MPTTTTYRSPQVRRLAPLLGLADRGTIALPPAVTAAIEAHARLNTAAGAIKVDTSDVSARLLDSIIGGGDIPPVSEVAAEVATIEASKLLRTAVSQAITHLEEMVLHAVTDHAATIITESIRPALEEVITEARAAVDALGAHPLEPGLLLTAPPKVREARAALDAIAAQYDELRQAQALCAEWDAAQVDGNNRFGEMRDIERFRPNAQRYANAAAPWPVDPVGRLVWLLRHGAELWCPSAAERDAQFVQTYPDAPISQGRAVIDIDGSSPDVDNTRRPISVG